MFCKQCGTENAEGSVFCKNCGINLSARAEATPAMHNQVKTPLSSNPVLNVVKKVACSPLFLIAAIAFTLNILFLILNSTTIGTNIEILLYNLADAIGGMSRYEIYELIDDLSRLGDAPYILLTILGQVPSILIAVGLWMTYSSARDRTTDTMKTSGLTMIKVVTIIRLVWNCIAFALVELLIMLVVALIATENIYDAALIMPVVVFVALSVAAVFVLEIVYYAKVIKSINTVKGTVKTGVLSDKVSSYVAVWNFIGAGFMMLTLPTALLSGVATITSLISFGAIIFKYKSEMKKLMTTQQ